MVFNTPGLNLFGMPGQGMRQSDVANWAPISVLQRLEIWQYSALNRAH